MEGNEIIPYIEQILRFCHHHLDNWHDAEDLAGDILLHALDGAGKYEIESPDAWVWRVAHNRYARFVDAKNRRQAMLSGKELSEIGEDYWQLDEMSLEEEYEPIFRYLHTLSSGYRDIFMDYYIGEMPVKQLTQKYGLSEAAVKWRLNVGRSRIRERIGTAEMDKVYQKIQWNTMVCNGGFDSDQYLHSQIARAICSAAYEKPVTVEEISLCTGIPTIYIEDELPKLIYGDTIEKRGNQYATDFIIFRLKDRADTEAVSALLVKRVADHYEKILWKEGRDCGKMGFYGCEFGMERLGYILVPYFIKRKLEVLKDNRLHLLNGNYPPRKDGGFGWFVVQEIDEAKEKAEDYGIGCNTSGCGGGYLYYCWMSRYLHRDLYLDGGTKWLGEYGIPGKCPGGIVPEGLLGEESMAKLLRKNLIWRAKDGYRLNFPCFTVEEFSEFISTYNVEDNRLDTWLCQWILSVRKSFEGFVPKRLHGQINQWISTYCRELAGHVMEELIRRGRLEKPETPGTGKPLVNGVFYVEGAYMEI